MEAIESHVIEHYLQAITALAQTAFTLAKARSRK